MQHIIELVFAKTSRHATAIEVAEHYDITTPTVHNWTDRGILPRPAAMLLPSRTLLWVAADLPPPSSIVRPKRGLPKGQHRRGGFRCPAAFGDRKAG